MTGAAIRSPDLWCGICSGDDRRQSVKVDGFREVAPNRIENGKWAWGKLSYASVGNAVSLVGQTISHYRVLQKLGEGAWVLFTKLRT